MKRLTYNFLKYDELLTAQIFNLLKCYQYVKNNLPNHYKKLIPFEIYEYFFHTDKVLIFIGCHWLSCDTTEELMLNFFLIDLQDQRKNRFESLSQPLVNNYILKSKKDLTNMKINFNSIDKNSSLISNDEQINTGLIIDKIHTFYKY